jgi:hypothetical protein
LSRRFYPMGKARAELLAPAANRLVADRHPALEQQLFNVAQTELEPVPPHRITDGRRREPVAVIKRFRFRHRIMLREHPAQRDSALLMSMCRNRIHVVLFVPSLGQRNGFPERRVVIPPAPTPMRQLCKQSSFALALPCLSEPGATRLWATSISRRTASMQLPFTRRKGRCTAPRIEHRAKTRP